MARKMSRTSARTRNRRKRRPLAWRRRSGPFDAFRETPSFEDPRRSRTMASALSLDRRRSLKFTGVDRRAGKVVSMDRIRVRPRLRGMVSASTHRRIGLPNIQIGQEKGPECRILHQLFIDPLVVFSEENSAKSSGLFGCGLPLERFSVNGRFQVASPASNALARSLSSFSEPCHTVRQP